MSLNSTTLVCCGQVAEFAGKAGPVDRAAVHQPHHRLVDRAMIAAVEDKDLRSTGDGACDAQRETIGVGRCGRDLPFGQAEALRQQPSEHQRILVGQHVGQPAAGLTADGARDRRRRMAEHRAGVAEAEIVEADAVDVEDVAPRARSTTTGKGVGQSFIQCIGTPPKKPGRCPCRIGSFGFRPCASEDVGFGGAQLC